MVRIPRVSINLYKVVAGVGFSLVWARVMYLIWGQPSYLTFVWFYLGVGSIVLKWVLFWAIDRIHLKLRVGALRKRLDEAEERVNSVWESPDSAK